MTDEPKRMPEYAARLYNEMLKLTVGQGVISRTYMEQEVWVPAYRDRGGQWNVFGWAKPHTKSAGVWLMENGFARWENGALVPVRVGVSRLLDKA